METLPPDSDADLARLRKLARTAAHDAAIWSHLLLAHAPEASPRTADLLTSEVLAFAAALLQLRLADAGHLAPAALADFRDALRAEHDRLLARLRRRPAAVHPRELLGTAAPADFSSALARYADTSQRREHAAQEVFAEFCRLTGLHSPTLVGDGPNLAALLFQFTVFTRLGFSATATRAQRTQLLRETQRCREHFLTLAKRFLASSAGALVPQPRRFPAPPLLSDNP